MAARRDRERRRPSGESRYRFAAPESTVEPVDEAAAVDGANSTRVNDPPAGRRSGTNRGTALDTKLAAVSTRGGARPTPAPFSSYQAEYAYVVGDLRRVGLVIGSLLVVLILLYFVLPH